MIFSVTVLIHVGSPAERGPYYPQTRKFSHSHVQNNQISRRNIGVLFRPRAVPLIGHAQTSVGGVTVVSGGQWTTAPGTAGTTNVRITYTGTAIISNNTGGPVTVNIVNLGGWAGYYDAWGTNQTTVQPGQTTYLQASKTIEVSANVVQNSGPAKASTGGSFSSLGNPEIGNGIDYASPNILGSLDQASKQQYVTPVNQN